MRIPVVFTINEAYVPYCCVAMCSLLEHASPQDEYVLYVFYDQMSEAGLARLRAFSRENARVEPVCVHGLLHDSMRVVGRFPKVACFRLMIAEALPHEERLLYMDCDVVVLEDLARLYATDIGDTLLGAVMCAPDSAQRMREGLGVEIEHVFYSGVLVINAALWREAKLFARCMDALERYPKIRFPDQDALAIACADRVTAIDPVWNQVSMSVRRAGLLRGGIVHMAGGAKPWNGSSDTDFAYWYDVAGRAGLLPPARLDPPDAAREWSARHFHGVRPAPLRALARRAGAVGYRFASAYVPRMRRYMKRVRVCVTTRCPGSCAHCEALCPHYAGRPDVEPKKLLDDLARLFHYTRGIGELRLTGGEPLGWEGLAEALSFALKSGRASRVVVETPGLIAPSPEVMELLRDRRVGVEVHGGVDVVNPNIAYFLCDKPAPVPLPPALRDVPGAVHSQEWVWADFGAFERRDVTDEALYWQARACGVDDYYYLNGRLYPCARMAHGAQLGMLPEAACRFADLRAARGAWRAARALEELFQRAPAQACRYCLRGTTDFLPVPPEI